MEEALALSRVCENVSDGCYKESEEPTEENTEAVAYQQLISQPRIKQSARVLEISIYASDTAMWEAITGHAADYKRVPRSEWLLLLGIASKKSQGILQGDLGRLVDQDKRSVPKRTDALVRKGYITKRTTLVRGTKTSKLWLKPFAPPLPKDGDATAKPETQMKLSRQILATNLEPVPWRTRWTGESVDYTALATTIMAICKAWGVMRMQDLKAKLGVLGMRWQMKVVSKVCRFLNARDAIQYVAAKLDNRVFKDCVKFNRDLTTKDWSIFLATGKRAGRLSKSFESGTYDGIDGADQTPTQHASITRLAVAPPATTDLPLPTVIARSVQTFGESGLTNPDVYGLTLGTTFTRFLSSMTTSMSTPDIQPLNVKHLQVKSEHSRVGKIASYRYSMLKVDAPNSSSSIGSVILEPLHTEASRGPGFRSPSYGFLQFSRVPQAQEQPVTLSRLCATGITQRRQRKNTKPQLHSLDEPHYRCTEGKHIESLEKSSGVEEGKNSLIISLKVNFDPTPTLVESNSSEQRRTPYIQDNSPKDNVQSATKVTGYTSAQDNTLIDKDPSALTTTSPKRMGLIRGDKKVRGRGRGRQHISCDRDALISKPWKCDKCGRTWKNDVGLKYHLEKSQTACNPLYTALAMGSPRRGRKPTSLSNGNGVYLKAVASKWAQDTRLLNKAVLTAVTESTAGLTREPFIVNTPLNVEALAESEPPVSISSVSNDDFIIGPYDLQNEVGVKTSLSWGPSTLLQSEIFQLRQIQPSKSHDQSFYVLDRASDPKRLSKLIPLSKLTTGSRYKDGRANHLHHSQDMLEATLYDSHHNIDVTGTMNIAKATKEFLQDQSYPQGGITDEKRASRQQVFNRICSTLTDMLSRLKGAIPGGESMWITFATVWNSKFSHEPVPKMKDCQWALSNMLKDRLVVEHWHGFQSRNGLFTKCQIITLPGLDAFSPESLWLLEKIRETHPQVYFPEQLILSDISRLPEKKDGRRGRRLLAGEVAVLDAPVYVAQIAAKRSTDTVNEIAYPYKRRRMGHHSKGGNGDHSTSTTTQGEFQVRWATEILPANSQPSFIDIPHMFPSTMSPSAEIRFLAPNTFMDEVLPSPGTPEVNQYENGIPITGNTESKIREDASTVEYLRLTPVIESAISLQGLYGTWPYLNLQYFESLGDASFSMCGWMPDQDWFTWASIVQDMEKRIASIPEKGQSSGPDRKIQYHRITEQLKTCMLMESMCIQMLVNSRRLAAGPHNVFINFSAGSGNLVKPYTLVWLPPELLKPDSLRILIQSMEIGSSSSSDEEVSFQRASHRRKAKTARCLSNLTDSKSQMKGKVFALATRALTAIPRIPKGGVKNRGAATADNLIKNKAEIMAAFVAVRALLGGADKSVDWGLLVNIFPGIGLAGLRGFWATACKEQGSYITKFTRDFQDRLIDAYDTGELPMLDYEHPMGYDWPRLIRWTMQIPRHEGAQIPQTRLALDRSYRFENAKFIGDGWHEKFFHVQSSIFSRFEAVTSNPGAMPVSSCEAVTSTVYIITDETIARSWIRSLCNTNESKYSVRQIRDKFLTISSNNLERTTTLLKGAIDQLTKQRVICRSKKPPLGGRPYRLNEWYVSNLAKISQRTKYEEAAAFKTNLDATFRDQKNMEISYTLNDGAMMALTNMSASGRIKLVPVGVPDIPLGFEPGNYESRKYPKSYYHFQLQAVPTENYLFNEDIEVLRALAREAPPVGKYRGELPQWADFFGEVNLEIWCEILGAFCFAFATRGSMTVDGICKALEPVLEEFEVQLIINWGRKSGVITGDMEETGITVGEWWWLAVPWQSKSFYSGKARRGTNTAWQ